MLTVDRSLAGRKWDLLRYFRDRSDECLDDLRRTYGTQDYRRLASAINGALSTTRANLLSSVLQTARIEGWAAEDLLRAILLVTYTSYVVMLDCRNEVWAYDYMSFSRRIGELWEPFCKLCFEHPLADVRLFPPPLFADVRQQLTGEFEQYLDTLPLREDQRADLRRYYTKVWTMVDAGQIKLELDLHFQQRETRYNIDFKSGFGSNEKGNTNRLLLVASIYRNIPEDYQCVLLVRSEEDENNNYFQTLSRSCIWEAFCGADTYDWISRHSGFDIKTWIQENVDWASDFTESTTRHLAEHELDRYLRW